MNQTSKDVKDVKFYERGGHVRDKKRFEENQVRPLPSSYPNMITVQPHPIAPPVQRSRFQPIDLLPQDPKGFVEAQDLGCAARLHDHIRDACCVDARTYMFLLGRR